MHRALVDRLMRASVAALLVLTQMLAVLHECSHLSQDLPNAAWAKAESGPCLLCVAYAPVLGALGEGLRPEFPVPVCMTPFQDVAYVFHPVLHFAFHAQAPPVSNAMNA